MALTFPLPFATFGNKLRLQGMKLKLDPQQDTSFSGGGDIYAADLAPAPWMGEGQIGILTAAQAAELQALFDVLDGSINSFYIGHPLYPYPSSDPVGTVLTAWATTIKISSINANNKELVIKDAPAGFVFPAGTFFHFDFGSSPVHRAFHRTVNAVTANGSGVTPSVEVRPHIRPGAAVDMVLEFKKPTLEARLIPNSYDSGSVEKVITSGMGFQFRQVI